jgi:multiple sugar transport system substrate-binding protein
VKNLYDYGVVESPLWTPAMGTALSTALANVVQNGADPAAELATAEETVNTELSRS